MDERDLYIEIRAALIAWQPIHMPTDPRLDYCLCGESWPCPEQGEPWEGALIHDVQSLGDALILDLGEGQVAWVLHVERVDRPATMDRVDLRGIKMILDRYGAPDVTPGPDGLIQLNLAGRLAFLLNPRNTPGFQRPLELLEENDRLRARVAELERRERER